MAASLLLPQRCYGVATPNILVDVASGVATLELMSRHSDVVTLELVSRHSLTNVATLI